MDTVKYIVKRLLLAVVILLGVSIIIYALARMMPTDYVDNQYSSAVAQGTMTQGDIDRIKGLYGLNMPEAYLDVTLGEGNEYSDIRFRKNVKESDYERFLVATAPEALESDRLSAAVTWFKGSYEGEADGKVYRIYLDAPSVVGNLYRLMLVKSSGSVDVVEDENADDKTENKTEDDSTIQMQEELELIQVGTYDLVYNGESGAYSVSVTVGGTQYALGSAYSVASFWDKAGAVLGGYFTWLGNLLQGDLGMSFKYKQPVGTVIVENMGISFGIMFVATILQFLIAIPLGIKAATHQYGVVDYTVTVVSLMGISLPTFFLGAIVIRVFAVELGWFEVGGLTSNMSFGAPWYVVFGDVLWHMVLPMFVLVVLSVGSLMRYTRTNTLEVLNADYIRTARAKGLSERSVIYKHAFRNTMIPLVTLMAGILPSLFGGAMITEQVFAIEGIGKLAYDALIVADVPFIMGYNMFLAIMTVIGTLLSDLMYAVVDPRVKLTK